MALKSKMALLLLASSAMAVCDAVRTPELAYDGGMTVLQRANVLGSRTKNDNGTLTFEGGLCWRIDQASNAYALCARSSECKKYMLIWGGYLIYRLAEGARSRVEFDSSPIWLGGTSTYINISGP